MIRALIAAGFILTTACLPRNYNESNTSQAEVDLPTAGLTGRVLKRGDHGWSAARQSFNARFDPKQIEPKLIVFVQNTTDVVNAVKWAREHKVEFRIRSGRHSYEAYSTVKDGMIIDVSDINKISFNKATRQATVGGGVKVQPLYEALWLHNVTIPGATASTIGVAGLVQGGGFGVTSRKWGTTSDQLVDAEVVLGDGRVVRANDKENPDLFWALRGGGGGNWGVITEMTFKTHPINKVGVYFVKWDWKDFDTVVGKWQKWAVDADKRVTTFLRLAADKKITLFAVFTPDKESELPQGIELIKPMREAAKPIEEQLFDLPYIDASRQFASVAKAVDGEVKFMDLDPQVFKSASAMAYKDFPPEALQRLKHYMEKTPQSGGVQPNMVQLLPGGGAPGTFNIDKMGVPHRRARFILQYDAYWARPDQEKQNLDWIQEMRNGLSPYTRGAYVNYHDSQMKSPLIEYYGPYLRRYVEVKAKYDPDNVFHHPQSIPVKLSEKLEAELRQLSY